MTVIAVKDGVMAADTQATDDSGMKVPCRKLYKMPNGALIGGSGSDQCIQRFIACILEGTKFELSKEEKDDFHTLILMPDGSLFEFEDENGWRVYDNEFGYAIGSGKTVATTAMFLGRSAEQAVEVAKVLAQGCGGGTDSLSIYGTPRGRSIKVEVIRPDILFPVIKEPDNG